MSTELTEAAAAGGTAALAIRVLESAVRLVPVWLRRRGGTDTNNGLQAAKCCPEHPGLIARVAEIDHKLDERLSKMGREITDMLVATGRLEERLIAEEKTLDRIMQSIQSRG